MTKRKAPEKADASPLGINVPVGTLFAFWPYDQYPYFCCGEVTRIRDDGLAAIKEFGNALFKPVLILPLSAGKQLKAKLQFLEHTYREETANLRKTADERLLNHVPELAATRKR